MKRNRFFAPLLALALLALGVSSSIAQTTTSSGAASTTDGKLKIYGTVTSTEGNTVSINTYNGTSMTFHPTGSALMPINLVVGDPVEVTYVDNGGQLVTERIIMAYPGPDAYMANKDNGSQGSSDYYSNRSGSAAQGYGSSSSSGSDRLPTTAGELPLFAFTGLLSLAAGLGLRRYRR